MTDRQDTCGNCKFWFRGEGYKEDANHAIGECRRHSPIADPRALGTPLTTIHPETWNSYWCGDWKHALDT